MAVGQPIEFFFDFISPYGYYASTRIDELAASHGREVRWRVFFMRGLVQEKLGIDTPIFLLPLKGEYFRQDVPRMARYFEVPYDPVSVLDFNPLPAERAFLWIDERDPAAARQFAKNVYRATFGEARNLSAPEAVAAEGARVGMDAAALLAALGTAALKEKLAAATEAAAARGVWGTPTFVVDGELWWGADRLALIDEWLTRGGW